jgi:RNA polymerase sigma-70 factor (ECF subfamily)
MSTSASPPASPSQIAAVHLRNERGTLLRYVASLVSPDLHQAEDIVQETLLRAWLRADRLDWQENPIRPWLFRTARNLALDNWRKERSVPVGIAWPGWQAAGGDDFTDGVADRDWLMPALRKLPRPHHEVLVYVHMFGFGGAEAARLLRIPRGTVKSRTHNALRSLRRELRATDADDARTAA